MTLLFRVRFGFTGVRSGQASGNTANIGFSRMVPLQPSRRPNIGLSKSHTSASYHAVTNSNSGYYWKRSCRVSDSVWVLSSRVDETCLYWCTGEFTAFVPLVCSRAPYRVQLDAKLFRARLGRRSVDDCHRTLCSTPVYSGVHKLGSGFRLRTF